MLDASDDYHATPGRKPGLASPGSAHAPHIAV
jgi:hypothetical protein